MDETTPQSTEAQPSDSTETAQPSRWQSLKTRFPRAAKVATVATVVTAAVGATHIARTVSARKQHLVEAGDHAKEALNEVAASVSPTDTES